MSSAWEHVRIMKTHHKTLFLLSCVAFLFAGVVIGQARKVRTVAKKPAPTESKTEKKNFTFDVTYKVTIKGNGEQKGEMQGEPDIKWTVDRSFDGKMRLLGPTNLRSGDKDVKGWESYENYGSKANPPTVKVFIKDRLEKFWEGPGEIGTHENKTDVTVWETDTLETGEAEDLTSMAVNPETRKYWVVLGVYYRIPKKTVRMSRFTITDRSAEGFGGKPTHEVSKPLEDLIRVEDIPMPSGDHLDGGRYGMAILFPGRSGQGDVSLPVSYPYSVSFSQTCFKPLAPFFEGIADTKTKVDICVEFSIWKVLN